MPAKSPLPPVTVTSLSAYDMIDSMGTNSNIIYQQGGTSSSDLPNRDGEIELINALKYLGIHHIRNQGLDDNPNENAGSQYPNAPSDYNNFLTIKNAIPNIKINYLVSAGAPPNWGGGSPSDQKIILLNLAKLGVLVSMEGPNEPNNQPTYSPTGTHYAQNVTAYNQIWTDWGAALKSLKNSDAAFSNVLILPPTSAVQGGNGSDGVEATYASSGLTDHTAYYDMMNFHSYSAEGLDGISLGDPRGDISSGNPPNWGCYQVSIANWGRYAMPGKPVIITESGCNTILSAGGGHTVSEQAQGIVLVSNYFWAKYFNAVRLYQYDIEDDSTDLTDVNANRWGFYRGDWSKKVAADYVHNFTSVLADTKQSDPTKIPNFTVSGKKTATWGATIAFSKSDGSYVIACNNILPWWDPNTGNDLTPTGETWTITFAAPSTYTITDVKTGVTTASQTGLTATISVRGYPMLVHVLGSSSMTTVILTGGNTWTVPSGVTTLSLIECTGGGGGGATEANPGNGGGNGGGGGAYASISDYAVTPGASISYVVGAGGKGGGNNGSSPGQAGGTTYFNSTTTVKAVGGKGSTLVDNTVAPGGSASSCVGTTRYSGGNGGPNTTFGPSSGAGGGAASRIGNGNAGSNDTVGTGGSSPGGGAGGISDTDGVSNTNGGGGGGGASQSRCGNGGFPGGGGGGDGGNITGGGGNGAGGQIKITYSS